MSDAAPEADRTSIVLAASRVSTVTATVLPACSIGTVLVEPTEPTTVRPATLNAFSASVVAAPAALSAAFAVVSAEAAVVPAAVAAVLADVASVRTPAMEAFTAP